MAVVSLLVPAYDPGVEPNTKYGNIFYQLIQDITGSVLAIGFVLMVLAGIISVVGWGLARAFGGHAGASQASVRGLLIALGCSVLLGSISALIAYFSGIPLI
jgi:hypothetical protein